MQPVPGVVLQIVQVHECGLAEVGVGQPQVPGLGGEHRLAARGQGGVPHGQCLVVGEVARLLLVGERVRALHHREHHVGLLHHLLAIQIEVGIVQHERVVLGRRRFEVPALEVREPGRLFVHAEGLVVRDRHAGRGVPPGRGLLVVHSEFVGPVRMAGGRVGCGQQVLSRHQVGVEVVPGDGAVLVGSGHAVDVEDAVRVVVAQGAPQPGGVHEEVEPLTAFELLVPAHHDVPDRGHGDVRVDVEGSRPRRPVGGTLGTVDRPPGEHSPRQPQLTRPFARCGQRRVPPSQGRRDGLGRSERENRQHVGLGVPEGVPVVPGSGQALRGNRPVLVAGRRLEHVEEGEPYRLLDLRVSFHLDVRAGPEPVQVGPLPGDQPVPAGADRGRHRSVHLVVHGRQRTLPRPAVSHELDQPQRLSGLQVRGHRQTADIRLALCRPTGAVGPFDEMVGRRSHPQCTALGAVHEP